MNKESTGETANSGQATPAVVQRQKSYCACREVRYKPRQNGDGTCSERWICVRCGAEFSRQSSVIQRQKKPTVVCLCGSSRYPDQHMEVMMQETLAGRIVIPMGLYGHADYPPGAKELTNDGDESTAVKQMLDMLHFAKIDLADQILVINPGGYVGSSTRREIQYAEQTGKQVRYYSQPQPKEDEAQHDTATLGEVWHVSEEEQR